MTFLTTNFDAELLFTETDSLTSEIKSEDVSEELFKHKDLFGFTNFSKKSKFYDSQNKMVVGKMNVENKGIPINKFVGLKPKMCSMLSDDCKKPSTPKGVNIATEFNEFRDNFIIKKFSDTK